MLTEENIKSIVSHYEIHKAFPSNQIICNVTGKKSLCIGLWKDKKIKQFGSVENFVRSYKCRQATKVEGKVVPMGAKKGVKRISKKKKNIQKIDENGEKVYDIPIMSYKPPQRMTLDQLADDSEKICLRPDVYLTNGRHCDGCPYYKICRHRLKELPKDIIFDGEKFVYKEVIKKKK